MAMVVGCSVCVLGMGNVRKNLKLTNEEQLTDVYSYMEL